MFSFELSAEHLEMKQWIHDFAEKRIRPAAQEWDEREETPWPLIQEAAEIGLYSVDFLQQIPPRLRLVVQETQEGPLGRVQLRH